jgi:hypothetical protein
MDMDRPRRSHTRRPPLQVSLTPFLAFSSTLTPPGTGLATHAPRHLPRARPPLHPLSQHPSAGSSPTGASTTGGISLLREGPPPRRGGLGNLCKRKGKGRRPGIRKRCLDSRLFWETFGGEMVVVGLQRVERGVNARSFVSYPPFRRIRIHHSA